MIRINVNIDHILNFISKDEILKFQTELVNYKQNLLKKTGPGHDFLGWMTLPSEIPANLIDEIEHEAGRIRDIADILVVIGIGGSYLGTRAVTESLQHHFSHLISNENSKKPLIIYAGHNLAEDYLAELLQILKHRDYAVTVISKSGTTTEPAIAFRLIKQHLEEKYGKSGARERIIAITDNKKGALKKIADTEGYKTFSIPTDVGGRYSVLTLVGLLPIAIAGYDFKAMITGARIMQELLINNDSIEENPAYLYVAARNALYRAGKHIEILTTWQPNLFYFAEWWKQLYGESEGKQHRGIFPTSVTYTTDLHSMGQYIQDGLRVIFETVLTVKKPVHCLSIPQDEENLDGLNFLAGKRICKINSMAELGTTIAHVDGGVPNIKISMDELTEYNIGQLIYFFEMACALSGYVLGVNPFNQPGVEAYKNNMFALLQKPGFEKESEVLVARIKALNPGLD